MATHSSTLAWKIPWMVAHQAPLSMEFSRQEYWNGLSWTAKWSNQSTLKEISPGCLEGPMLKLKLQYFGHLMWRADSFEKTLTLGKIEGRRRRGRQRMRCLHGITDSMDMVWVDSRSWWWTGRPDVLQFMGSQRLGHDWGTELNWTELNAILYSQVFFFFNLRISLLYIEIITYNFLF